MIHVHLATATVDIELTGWSRLWAFKCHLSFPRDAIRRVYRRPKEMRPPWFRLPGTYVPLILAAGTYRAYQQKEFWYTRFTPDCLVFELSNGPYTRVVVDTDRAGQLMAKLS